MSNLKKQDIDRLKPRALLVQAYQNSGDVAKRDSEHQQIKQLWKAGKIFENAYIRDEFSAGKYGVAVFDYFQLKGDMPLKYTFIPQNEQGKYPFIIILSAQFIGAAGNQMYSLQVLDGKKRYIHIVYEVEPSYDEVKKLAYKIIESGDLNNGSEILGSTFAVDLKTWLFGGKTSAATKKSIHNKMQKSLHYQYAYQLLPKTFFDNSKQFFALLDAQGKKHLQSLFAKLVDTKGDRQQKLNSDELDYSVIHFSGNNIAIIKLPKPSIVPEAYYVALVTNNINPEISRYFTFEKISPVKSSNSTELAILCELTEKGLVNYGIGSDNPSKENFSELILDVLSGKIDPQLKSKNTKL